jgi:ADP-ribose pyrophosphatase YjhB (NUDIX family)
MQMYKVFIENMPVIFKINKHLKKECELTKEEIWEKINWVVSSKLDGLIIELSSKSAFKTIFSDYKFIKAAGGIVQRKNKFLFIKRLGVWDIPKGKVEKGETIEQTAIRELVEECGIHPPTIKMHLTDTYHTYEMKGKKYLKRTYWFWFTAHQKDKKMIPQKEEGITKVKFVKQEKFDKIRSNTYKSIIDVLDVLESKLEKG